MLACHLGKLACVRGHLEIVRYRVERGGANVDAAQTTNGATALMAACDMGRSRVVSYLVTRGGINVNAARTSDGSTALILACTSQMAACQVIKGNPGIVRCLLERGGANVNAARTTDGVTALMIASAKGYLETVRHLLQHGADKLAVSHSGRNAFSHAADHPPVQAALV